MAHRHIVVLIATVCGAIASAALAAASNVASHAASHAAGTTSPPGMTYDSLKSLPDFGGWWALKLQPRQAQQPPFKPKPAAVMSNWRRKIDSGVDPQDVDGLRRSYCSPARFAGFNGGLQDYVEFLFTPGRVTIANELGLIRRIRLSDEPLRGTLRETNTGVSVGHWEGRTLVVETRGLKHDTGYGEPVNKLPVKIGRNVRILERFSLTGPDLMQVTMQMTAPDLLTRPYEVTMYYVRDRKHEFQEITNCSEGDRAFDDATGRERFDLTPPPDLPPPPSRPE